MREENQYTTSALDTERLSGSVTEGDLIEAVEGRSGRFGRVEALKELRRRFSPRLPELFVKLVADRNVPSELRTAVIVALGEEAKPEHQNSLIAVLSDPDPAVARRAAAALGRIGNTAALERLSAFDPPASRGVKRAVEFARILISYRLSLGTYRLSAPPAGELLEVINPVPFQMEPADPELLKRIFSQLRTELPAIRVSATSALSISCLGARLLALLTEEVERSDIEKLLQKDVVVGVILKLYSTGLYKLSEYLLLHPGEGRALLFGVEASGILIHSGQAQIHPSGARFELRAINTVHSPPIGIAGEYYGADRRLVLTRAVADADLAPQQKRPAIPQKSIIDVPPRTG